MYNSKIKSKVDMKRIQNEKDLDMEESGEKFVSVNKALKGMGVKAED